MTNSNNQIRKDASAKYERMLDLSVKITDDFNSARRLDIEQLRGLLIQVSVVSFGAVGFSIPILGTSSLLRHPLLFVTGLILLLIPAIGGLWYSAIIIEDSLNKTFHGYKRNKEEIDEAISNQVFLMQNPDKYDEFTQKVSNFVKDLKDKTSLLKLQRDKVLYILLISLTFGIILVFLSLFPIRGGLTLTKGKVCHLTANCPRNHDFHNLEK